MYIREIFLNRNLYSESILVDEMGELDEEYHHVYFRMDKAQFDTILTGISGQLFHASTHARPISTKDRLSITLRYLATGSKQVYLAMNYRISPPSVSVNVRETMEAICTKFGPEFLKEPNEQDWLRSSMEFERKWNFPGAIAAMDGKHIRIKKPANSGSVFINYKKFSSIVLLALVDAKYNFLLVDIGCCGSVSDGGVLKNSRIGRKFESNRFKLPQPRQMSTDFAAPPVILADDAFPLKPYIMKPFPGRQNGQLEYEQKIFNYRISRGRNVAENAFGIYQARWRIFETPIHGSPDLIKLIVKTCVILHNFLNCKNDSYSLTVDREVNGEVVPGNWRQAVENDSGMASLTQQGSHPNNATMQAFQVREGFKNFFASPAGQVAWQNQFALRGYN